MPSYFNMLRAGAGAKRAKHRNFQMAQRPFFRTERREAVVLEGCCIGHAGYGEQQRVMLARALIRRPELLIFDEPTTALDPETRDVFYALTQKLNRQEGTTVALVTHDSGVVGQYAQHLLYLDKKVIFSGTFRDFCASADMTGFFGATSQHIICHQHDSTGSGR